MARGKRESVRSVLLCSIARPAKAVGASTILHPPSPPLPVRAKVKPEGGDPSIMRSMAIMGAPVCAKINDPVDAKKHAARAILRAGLMPQNNVRPLLFTGNLSFDRN